MIMDVIVLLGYVSFEFFQFCWEDIKLYFYKDYGDFCFVNVFVIEYLFGDELQIQLIYI